ncbi:MAG: type II secretion system protein [Planctomycetes bacterium]|nr:type II secretion system protein [Planctomycetota bacterium]
MPDVRRLQRGFTLLELMIVVTILGIIASVGVPQYVSALRTARVGKARHELVTIASAIDQYTVTNGGSLPLSLHLVGFGGKRDPWGQPYCFLNYADGCGDGLEWAIAAGVVDPAAVQSTGGSSSSSSSSSSGAGGGGAAPRRAPQPRWRPQDPIVVQVDAAVSDRGKVAAQRITSTLSREVPIAEVEALAAAITSTGGFSFFTGVATETTRRRDRYMFPLNTDYDLFSLGPDCSTAVSLGETVGLDDVIRANNGGYFGTASEY